MDEKWSFIQLVIVVRSLANSPPESEARLRNEIFRTACARHYRLLLVVLYVDN